VDSRWTLLRPEPNPDKRNPRALYRCACGTERAVAIGHVRSGRSKSCGCLSREAATRHGMYGTPEYSSWRSMVRRCTKSYDKEYERYRDVPLSEQWRTSFDAFYAHVGARPNGTTLDRIDNATGYVPGNVRWATPQQQSRNRSSVHFVVDRAGEALNVTDMARKHNVSRKTISRRLRHGEMSERARD
jgi:hypothetical protein